MEKNLATVKKVKAAVIGASGYTGLELLKILSKHRLAEIKLVTSNSLAGKVASDVFPALHEVRLAFVSTDSVMEKELSGTDVVFLCLPSLKSMDFVKNHLKGYRGAIIDIGSDFRLKDPDNFKKWYGKDHLLIERLDKFVYGLPELNLKKIKNSKYIANPGCYPTSIILALAPLLDPASNTYFEISDINIDSKSGVSGAGRKLKDDYLFYSINENFYAYSPVLHRHIGEIEQELENISGRAIKVCFTPHLLPVDRGIFSTISCKVHRNNSSGAGNITDDLKDNMADENKNEYMTSAVSKIFRKYCKGLAFVKFRGQIVPQIKDVAATNFCHIGFAFDERTDTLKLFSVIDNLIKGAAGQAVQNMNIMFNFDQQEGLSW